MLLSLQIKNFILIENTTIEWGKGLHVLSGETGSGKSLLVQALDFLLGARASEDFIRQGEDEAEVSALFSKNDEEVSLRRVLTRGGRGKAYMNERPVPLSALEAAGRELVDFAGQHEHQILLEPASHVALLDAFSGLENLLNSYGQDFREYQEKKKQYEATLQKEKEAREQEDFLRFQLQDLSQVNVQDGEEEALLKEKDVVKNAVRLGEASYKAEAGLDSGEDSIGERLSAVHTSLLPLARIDEDLSGLIAPLEEALCRVQETAQALRKYAEKISFDPERLQEIEDRLDQISRLKKKYGGSLESIKKKKQEVEEALNLLDRSEDSTLEQKKFLEAQEKKLLEKAEELTRRRKEGGRLLARRVETELKDLGMETARFQLSFKAESQNGVSIGGRLLNEKGQDDAEFLLAPNPGEGWHPLAKIASGGEMSRVFLALKKVLGEVRSCPTFVFDEVDTGVGGRLAEVIGQKLSSMAESKQILCITHLPQIACYADQHFIIEKQIRGGRTGVSLTRLEKKEREEEIARMLAGVKITHQALAQARALLKDASLRSG